MIFTLRQTVALVHPRTRDSRCSHGGVIAFTVGENTINVVGRATGPVNGEQTVFSL